MTFATNNLARLRTNILEGSAFIQLLSMRTNNRRQARCKTGVPDSFLNKSILAKHKYCISLPLSNYPEIPTVKIKVKDRF